MCQYNILGFIICCWPSHSVSSLLIITCDEDVPVIDLVLQLTVQTIQKRTKNTMNWKSITVY